MSNPAKAFREALQRQAISTLQENLQSDFPWNAGNPAEKALEQQWDLMERYRRDLQSQLRLNDHQPFLREHFDLVAKAQSALQSAIVTLKRANGILYKK